MIIPQKLKIGGHEYRVQFHSESELYTDSGDCGVTNRKKGIIEISDALMPTEKESTLIHEILHVVNSEIDHALLDSLAQQIHL